MFVKLHQFFLKKTTNRCKVVLAGCRNVGKSALIERLSCGEWHEKKIDEKLTRVVLKKHFEINFTVEFIEIGKK